MAALNAGGGGSGSGSGVGWWRQQWMRVVAAAVDAGGGGMVVQLLYGEGLCACIARRAFGPSTHYRISCVRVYLCICVYKYFQ